MLKDKIKIIIHILKSKNPLEIEIFKAIKSDKKCVEIESLHVVSEDLIGHECDRCRTKPNKFCCSRTFFEWSIKEDEHLHLCEDCKNILIWSRED